MRDIKFRMWNPCGSHFHYGLQALECLGQQQHKIYDHEKNGCAFEQFTGRRDNNSIDIYDGDILEYAGAPGMEDGTVTVVWHEAESCWYIENSDLDIYDMLYNVIGHCIVIGNVHEKGGHK